VTTHHPWFTVQGGAVTYLKKIVKAVGAPHLEARVVSVEEGPTCAKVRLADGGELEFDRVILASHADESLAVLPNPDAMTRDLLGAFRYEKNHATLHTWEGVMPKSRLAWASWNYKVDGTTTGGPATHYWMNALQGVSKKKNYFVSLNSKHDIPTETVLYETEYDHPIFNLPAVRAQENLNRLNTRSRDQRLFFCGSYFKYGFHEDAYSSALYLSMMLRERLAD
jgi:predicted NAD/FAD-binding protein